jgi:hypothetical protein
MKYVQYEGPHDTRDMSSFLGKPAVFHSTRTRSVPADLRGNVMQVTNDQFEELMTHPNHRFVEVAEEDAKALIAAQTSARKQREDRAAEREAASVFTAPTSAIEQQIAALPKTTTFAPSAPATAAEIKAEVKATETAAATADSGTTTAKGK